MKWNCIKVWKVNNAGLTQICCYADSKWWFSPLWCENINQMRPWRLIRSFNNCVSSLAPVLVVKWLWVGLFWNLNGATAFVHAMKVSAVQNIIGSHWQFFRMSFVFPKMKVMQFWMTGEWLNDDLIYIWNDLFQIYPDVLYQECYSRCLCHQQWHHEVICLTLVIFDHDYHNSAWCIFCHNVTIHSYCHRL